MGFPFSGISRTCRSFDVNVDRLAEGKDPGRGREADCSRPAGLSRLELRQKRVQSFWRRELAWLVQGARATTAAEKVEDIANPERRESGEGEDGAE